MKSESELKPKKLIIEEINENETEAEEIVTISNTNGKEKSSIFSTSNFNNEKGKKRF